MTTTDRRTGPAERRTERRAGRDDRSGVGRSVAERALRQIRLVAVALVLLGAAGYRPDGAGGLDRTLALVLAGAAAATLLLVSVLSVRAARAGARARIRLVLACSS